MTRAMTDMDQTWEEFVDEVIYFAARDGAAPMSGRSSDATPTTARSLMALT